MSTAFTRSAIGAGSAAEAEIAAARVPTPESEFARPVEVILVKEEAPVVDVVVLVEDPREPKPDSPEDSQKTK